MSQALWGNANGNRVIRLVGRDRSAGGVRAENSPRVFKSAERYAGSRNKTAVEVLRGDEGADLKLPCSGERLWCPSGERGGAFRSEVVNASLDSGEPPINILTGFKHQWLAATKQPGLAASEFWGVWKVQDSNGKPFQITLSGDGSAKADRGEGMTGTWKDEDGAAVIKWDTGWTNKITKEGNKYKKTAYEKGKPLEGPPTNSSDAEKVE